MKILRSECHNLAEPQIKLAEALVANAPDRDQLCTWAKSIWPALHVYQEHTHWRFYPNGEPCNGPSFYVDLAGDGIENPKPFPFIPEKGASDIFSHAMAGLRANNSERRVACQLAVPALKRLVQVMSSQTGQGYKLRALLYSLYNGQPACLLDVVCLDWVIRKDLGAVILAFGFEDAQSSTHFFYDALKSAVQAAGLWNWFVEEEAVEH